MSRATKALAALAALAATASAAHPAAVPAPANCSRHIRLGVFEEAIPYAVTYMTGWMDNAATACFSFHHILGRSQTPDTANARSFSFHPSRSGTDWMKGKSFKRLSHTRSDALSPGSSPASTHSSVDPRSQHRGAFFRASVANLDA